MSSIQGTFAKRVTNNFVVIPTNIIEGVLNSGCYLLSKQGFAQWVSDNASILTVVENTYTTSIANFPNLVNDSTNGISNSKYYTLPDYGYINQGIELTDLGKDVFIGVPGQANILHLRLVQAPGTLANLGEGGWVGYVAVETNASDIFTDPEGGSVPVVSVARV